MSDDNGVDIKGRLLDLFSDLDDVELESIEKWICSQEYKKDLDHKRCLLNLEKKLKKIGNSLKKLVPFEAELPSEKIVPPTIGDQADCNNVNTLHIDAFLYDEDDVDKLVKKDKLKRSYCEDCYSRNVKAHYLSDVGTIIGIEINKECCEIQEKIIDEFAIDNNKVKVIHSDIMERGDIVANSDIIVINVLDFFVDNQKHRDLWYFFKKHIRKGSYLISNRSMTETLSVLDIFEDFMSWLSICRPNQLENEKFFNIEDCCELFLYTVN